MLRCLLELRETCGAFDRRLLPEAAAAGPGGGGGGAAGGSLFMARSVVSETVCGHKELSAPTRVSAMFSSHTSTELPNCDAPAESH